MPFGTITVQTKSYEPRIPGVYELSTVSFGEPSDRFTIRGATPSKDGLVRGSITRVLEKDVTISGQIVRSSMNVTLSFTIPQSNFSASDIDYRVEDISSFLTASVLSRILQGES